MNRAALVFFIFLLVPSSAFAKDPSRHKMDIDRDGTLETIIAEEIYDNDPNYPHPIETKVSIIESNSSLADEVLVPNGHPKVEFVIVSGKRAPQLVVWTSGGAHYTNLNIFNYSNGKLIELFSNGSGCEVDANFKTHRAMIKIGRADRSDPEWNYSFGRRLWNVYTWNGKEFAFDAKKSTSKEISEDEEVTGFVKPL